MSQTELNPEADEADISAELRGHIATGDAQSITDLLGPLPFSEALREILSLSAEERDTVLNLVPAELAAELIEEAPNEVAVEMVERLQAAKAAEIIDELDSNIQADVIGEMDQPGADAILAEMDAEDADDVRRLVEYDDDTAGGLMVAETFAFEEKATVGAVLRRLASDEEDFERYRGQHPYVIDAEGAPVGVVSLRNLLTAKRSSSLTDIMVEPMVVQVSTKLDELQDLFDEFPFLGMPVVEADGKLVGVVSRSAVSEAALERAESENLKLQGIVGDELRSMPLGIRSRRRLAWLSANIVLNIIAASVISAYEETLAAVIAIAVFLPMVSDMSGCSGNQAVGVTMRELVVGSCQAGRCVPCLDQGNIRRSDQWDRIGHSDRNCRMGLERQRLSWSGDRTGAMPEHDDRGLDRWRRAVDAQAGWAGSGGRQRPFAYHDHGHGRVFPGPQPCQRLHAASDRLSQQARHPAQCQRIAFSAEPRDHTVCAV